MALSFVLCASLLSSFLYDQFLSLSDPVSIQSRASRSKFLPSSCYLVLLHLLSFISPLSLCLLPVTPWTQLRCRPGLASRPPQQLNHIISLGIRPFMSGTMYSSTVGLSCSREYIAYYLHHGSSVALARLCAKSTTEPGVGRSLYIIELHLYRLSLLETL